MIVRWFYKSSHADKKLVANQKNLQAKQEFGESIKN